MLKCFTKSHGLRPEEIRHGSFLSPWKFSSCSVHRSAANAAAKSIPDHHTLISTEGTRNYFCTVTPLLSHSSSAGHPSTSEKKKGLSWQNYVKTASPLSGVPSNMRASRKSPEKAQLCPLWGSERGARSRPPASP